MNVYNFLGNLNLFILSLFDPEACYNKSSCCRLTAFRDCSVRNWLLFAQIMGRSQWGILIIVVGATSFFCFFSFFFSLHAFLNISFAGIQCSFSGDGLRACGRLWVVGIGWNALGVCVTRGRRADFHFHGREEFCIATPPLGSSFILRKIIHSFLSCRECVCLMSLPYIVFKCFSSTFCLLLYWSLVFETSRIWKLDQSILSRSLWVLIRGITSMQQLKRLFKWILLFLFFPFIFFPKILIAFLYFPVVFWWLHNSAISLWWTDEWMGWVRVVKACNSCQCKEAN